MNQELLFQSAINHQNQGNLQNAAQDYYALLQMDANHFGALVNLGSILKRQGNNTDALMCFQRALQLNQSSPELWFNYANLLQAQDKLDDALNAFKNAIKIKPDFFAAHFNLANLLRDTNDLEKAETHYRQTIKLKPDFVRVYTNLGNVLRRLKKFSQAIAMHQNALKLNPDDADIHYNLGRAMIAAEDNDAAMIELQKALHNRLDFYDAQLEIANLHLISQDISKAESIYDKLIIQQANKSGAYLGKTRILIQTKDNKAALEYAQIISDAFQDDDELAINAAELAIHCKQYKTAIKYCNLAMQSKDNQGVHYNLLGLALLHSGDSPAAHKAWLHSIALDPKNEVDARTYLGQLLHQDKKHDQALNVLRQAVKIAPNKIGPSLNLGFVLTKLGVIGEAIQLADDLIEQFPEAPDAHALRGFLNVQNASIQLASESLEKAIALHQKQKEDKGAGMARALMPSIYSDSLFSALYNHTLNASDIKTMHQDRCIELFESVTPNKFTLATDIDQRPLRIAYLSPDLHAHPIAFFIEPILANHNPEHCKIFCYSLSSVVDEVTKRLMDSDVTWRDCAYLLDDEIIAQMQKDKIDIVIDLAGHTANNRMSVLAKRAAPIQVIYLGYPSTTGLAQMDYMIADKHLIESEDYYTEKPMSLEGMSFLCYQAQPEMPDVRPPPCLENGYITFGSFNNLPKVTPTTIALWSKVLKAVPNSRLVLKALAFIDEPTKNLFWQRFKKQGIERNRIDLQAATRPLSKFMGKYGLMDIALDTVPFNGGTTTCDALWMGVPVLTLVGDKFCGRMSNSILQAVNMTDWITYSENEFIEKAIKFAADKQHLEKIRVKQRPSMATSPLCQAKDFTIQLEKLYRKMVVDKQSNNS